MEFLRAQLASIQDQLRTLTASQRIAIAMSLVVIVCAGIWLMAWAGEGQWTPIWDQSLSSEQIAQIESVMTVAGVETKIEGDRVLIRGSAEARRRAEAVLAQNNAAPRDTSLSYEALLKDRNPFVSDQDAMWRKRRGLEYELSAVLREFKGVREARVLLTIADTRSFRDRGKASSAAVAVRMASDESVPKSLVSSIANYVAAAAGLKVNDVKITDGLRSYRTPDESEAVPSEILDLQRHHEDLYAKKIYDQLRNIVGVVVNVNASLRNVDEHVQETKSSEPKLLQETSDTEERTGARGAAGPGVRPNSGLAVASGGTGTSETREKTESIFDPNRDTKVTRVEKPAGYLDRMMASISVPRGYLEGIVRNERTADDKNPVTPADIQQMADRVLPRIRKQVMPLINATDDDQVVVDWYYDAVQAEAIGTSAAENEKTDYVALAREFGPQVGLGVLALFSVMSVMRMAKRSPGHGGSGGSGGRGRERGRAGGGGAATNGDGVLASLSGGPLAVGEAEEIGGVLEGREVDEEAVRTQQIARQIGLLVKEDPAIAAGLVERWIRDDR